MSELHSPQPAGGTGTRPATASGNEVNANLPHGQTSDAGPCGGGDVTGCDTGLAGRPRPRVGAAEADDAARIADGGTTCEGPLVGDGTQR